MTFGMEELPFRMLSKGDPFCRLICFYAEGGASACC